MAPAKGAQPHRLSNAHEKAWAMRHERGEERLNRFADLLADEVHPVEAARQMGLNPNYGWGLLAKLRKRLGWQAQ